MYGRVLQPRAAVRGRRTEDEDGIRTAEAREHVSFERTQHERAALSTRPLRRPHPPPDGQGQGAAGIWARCQPSPWDRLAGAEAQSENERGGVWGQPTVSAVAPRPLAHVNQQQCRRTPRVQHRSVLSTVGTPMASEATHRVRRWRAGSRGAKRRQQKKSGGMGGGSASRPACTPREGRVWRRRGAEEKPAGTGELSSKNRKKVQGRNSAEPGLRLVVDPEQDGRGECEAGPCRGEEEKESRCYAVTNAPSAMEFMLV
ncbi:hypothetical protein C8R47DRAFT_1064137 [Mycena vitilis]|nr:hypothetical protein C8R47DRAFT_1064137 [Mycena vitilis]